MNFDASAQHITEFLTLMRKIRIRGTTGRKGKTDWFHFIFLGVRNNPLDGVPELRVLFFKEILLFEYNLGIVFLAEKFI